MDVATLSLRIDTTGMSEAQTKMEGLTNTAGFLEKAAKAAIAAFAFYKAGDWIKDVTQLAARYETLGVVMGVVGNIAGYTKSEMDGFDAALQKTGISMIESRNNLSSMAAAQLDLSKAAELGRLAQDAAVIAQINSSEAFERLVQGIVSGQPRILHTMKIFADFGQAEKKWADSHGKTMETLTQAEKVQIRFNATLEEGAKRTGVYEAAMGTVGKQALSMQRYVQNLEVAFGEVFKPAYEVIVQGLTSALKDSFEWLEKNATSVGELGSSMALVVKQGSEFTKFLGALGGGSDGASNSVSFLTRLFQGIGFLMAGATDILRAFAGEFISFIGSLVQKLGWAADKLTTLLGFSGKGGISRVGDSIGAWGNGINANLKNGGNTALTSWYDDVLGDKAGGKPGRTKEQEQAAIAEGIAARAAAASASAMAEASKRAEEYAKSIMGLNQALGLERVTLEQGDRAAYAYSLTIKGMKDADKEALLVKWDYNKALKDQAEKEAWIQRLDHDIRSGDKQRNSNAFAGRQNDMEQEAADWSAMIQAAYPWISESQQIAQTQELLNLAFDKGAVGLDIYRKRTLDLDVAMLRLKAEAGDTWAIIGYTITQSAGHATDAMVTWMDNLDGVGRSWRTLGDTVKNVLRDMIIQMQKALIEEQIMKKGMDWASNGANWAALWGSLSGQTTMGGDGNMGPQPEPELSPGGGSPATAAFGGGNYNAPAAFKGGSTGDVSITINNNGGSDTTADVKGGGQAAVGLAKMIKGVVNEWADEQSRQGGRLAGAR